MNLTQRVLSADDEAGGDASKTLDALMKQTVELTSDEHRIIDRRGWTQERKGELDRAKLSLSRKRAKGKAVVQQMTLSYPSEKAGAT